MVRSPLLLCRLVTTCNDLSANVVLLKLLNVRPTRLNPCFLNPVQTYLASQPARIGSPTQTHICVTRGFLLLGKPRVTLALITRIRQVQFLLGKHQGDSADSRISQSRQNPFARTPTTDVETLLTRIPKGGLRCPKIFLSSRFGVSTYGH